MDYDFSKYNHETPFCLKLTGNELKSLFALLDAADTEKLGEMAQVKTDLHIFMATFHSQSQIR